MNICRVSRACLFLMALLVVSLMLKGCSRQSTTDFTPFPSSQSVVQLGLAPAEQVLTLESGVQVNLSRVEIGWGSIAPIESSGGAVSAALAAHTEEDSHTEESGETAGTSAVDDPNVEAGDSRPLVPLSVPVNTAVNLLEECIFGVLNLRSGVETGWKVTCIPQLTDLGTVSILVTGTANRNGQQSNLRVLVEDPFEVVFATRAAVAAGVTEHVGLHFHVGEWFENLGLENLVGQGDILIDEGHADLHERLLANVKSSAAYEGVEHEHE